ncbi:hypothetical protein E2C01_025871 [Portunus trituberculatus]|uniref:Uncharacterized protein n=1 Tax=Portunus trituberculatus TaxID=210409 RepID=A0A5B7EGL8_PORTR|nr:hypothetical protein [Portunus trituberculatus]
MELPIWQSCEQFDVNRFTIQPNTYHVVPELIVKEVSCHMSWEKVEQDAAIAFLQSIHVLLLLGSLVWYKLVQLSFQ